MNGHNIELFQFEFDLTFMSFFMDANNHFYSRYGGRDGTDAESHLNKESLVRVMRQVQELHKKNDVQSSRYESTAKSSRTPEQIPTMRKMIAGRKNKCIHCHDVKVAGLRHLQDLGKFKREMVFTYPTPVNVGINVDPKRHNIVRTIKAGSPASNAGIRKGDTLLSADGQRILSLADFARVLELKPNDSTLPLKVERAGRTVEATLKLSGNWRRGTDPSWRESLHVAGPSNGLWGRKLKPNERKRLDLDNDVLALKVTFIWGGHTKAAGVRVNDVILSLDGIRRDMNIQQLHAHSMLNRNWGDTINVEVLRNGKKQNLTMTFPKSPPR